jgi:hemerythrin-like domain-containing protein
MSLLTDIKERGKKIEKVLSRQEQGDVDVLDTLKKEHEEVAAMLTKLVESESRTERKSLLRKIKSALVPHVRAEEKVIYDAIIALKGREPREDGEEGYLEHGLADKILATLGKISNPLSPEFSAAAKVLKELIEHHVEEEENHVWSDVRQNFSADDRLLMNRQFEAAKKKVRV